MTTATADHWLPYGEPDPTLPRVFCFPHAGGGAASFRPLLAAAGPLLAVCPVQPPGRAERFREPLHRDVESYVDDFVRSAGHLLTGEFALFGHSAGALVAYRLAHRLVAARRPPVHLFVSGRTAPHLSHARQTLHDLPTEELIPHLRVLGGTPDVVLDDPGLLEVFLPVLRADFALNETYRHDGAAPLPIPLTAFGGADDPRAGPAELRGWRALTSSRFETRFYPGGHFYLDHHAAAMLAVIRRAFKRESMLGKPVGE
jgi:medium-chain acyl-[acyl-carrier-protein] hydrolase